MGAPAITILWNSTSNNVANTGGASGDSNWKIFNNTNDQIAFLGGGTDDQDPNTGKDVFVIPESGNQEAPKQFVNDYSASKWDRVFLAGSDADQGGGGNYRFAYAAYVDGTTASAPVLQAWDSTTHTTTNLAVLGSGTPADSMIRAVSTRAVAPGASWAGTPIAGASNTVALDTTAITNSENLYWNMRLLVPSTADPFTSSPILAIYVTYA